MDLLPAIDVLGESAVRLRQGDYAEVTGYGAPVELARRYAEGGLSWLHVVDLAAARTGQPPAPAVLSELLELLAPFGTRLQLGGGVRSAGRAESLLSAGVARVVLGTAAFEEPGLVERLAADHPGRIAVGLDHRRLAGERGGPPRRVVAVAGWQRNLPLDLLEAAARFEHLPLGALVVTDIGRDGMLLGPDLEGYLELLEACPVPLVASGGVSSRADLEALASLEVAGRRLSGVIVGKALLDGRVSLDDAFAACAVASLPG